MCAEKIHRLLMATVISIATWLLYAGFQAGFFLLLFVIGMIVVWAVTDFCPSLFVIKKLGVRSCYKKTR